jgi:hypothetical protein
MNSQACSHQYPVHVQFCPVCGRFVGYPNVRAASDEAEALALNRRREAAENQAGVGGYADLFSAFGSAVSNSVAVTVRSLAALDSFVASDSQLMISYHRMVRAGSRIPENNDWDPYRAAADSTVNPHYYEEIQFGALSLDGRGVKWFGDYHITFDEDAISHRSTIFEENPFIFCRRKKISAGQGVPVGYRSLWQNRGILAQAKLGAKLRGGEPAAFQAILVEDAAKNGEADYIEVHIFGDLHRRAIKRVIGPRPSTDEGRVIWRTVRRNLEEVGAELVET